MAKEKFPDSKKKTPVGKSINKLVQPAAGSLLDIMDRSLSRSLPWLVWIFMGLTLLFSLLLFDPKVSLSGDDSFYIIRAYDFVHSFKYPSFQGPLYPMVLGLVVDLFGISLTPLKFISLVAMLAFIYLTYKALRNRIPSTILVAALALVTINSYLLYYASQTYSEAFYIFMQVLLVVVFFKEFIDKQSALGLRPEIRRHLLLAICLLALTLTRSIGYSAIFAIGGYFLLQKQWKNLLYFILAFAGIFLVFQGLKYALWHEGGLQFSTQGGGLLNKDYYNASEGKETLTGLLKRFYDNSNLYFSKHFMYMIGLRTYEATMVIMPFITLCVYLISLAGLVLVYRKNNYIFFIGLLAGSFILVTFIALQAKWDQGRLIIPALSMIIFLFLSAFYYFTQFKKLKFLQFLFPLFILIVFMKTFSVTATQVTAARELSGRFGGLTPDWKHYLQASEWAAANLPKEAVIACRKPSISFVYGNGRNFYGIMQMPTYDADGFLNVWRKNEQSFITFSYADFTGKQISPEVYTTLKRYMYAQFFVGDKFFFIDRFPDSIREKTIMDVKTMGITGIRVADSLRAIATKENKPYTLVYPDSLLNTLVRNKVDYVLTANLRRNMLVKNGQIINTVERYMAFIEDKYQGIMTKVTQIGDDENEPAAIMKINYERAGIIPRQ